MSLSSDVIVIGGGMVGLAIAVELQQRGASVTVFSRQIQEAASIAAAGMLAPHAEELEGVMLDLCLKSRWLYAEWVKKLEQLTGLETSYHPCGILAPVYELPDQKNTDSLWLDQKTIQLYQPGLGEDVIGGWWYPEDGQVDNRKVTTALRQATEILGITVHQGVSVTAISQKDGQVQSISTSQGEFTADTYVVASGSWASQLLPLPVRPIKGQMLALRMPTPPDQPLPLQRVLFAPQTYLVPRQDGRLIVGATVEDQGWTPHNTPNGVQTLIQRAIRLYPSLADWPIEDYWWGFRPSTPDELPILGYGDCKNLILATGHYRNGILLTPITAKLIADLIIDQKVDPLLSHFQADRFYNTANHNNSKMTTVTASSSLSVAQNNGVTIHPELIPDDPLIIAGKSFNSRLMTGTGKYPSMEVMQQSVASSGCQIVTVAVRRVQTKAPGHEGLAEALDWSQIWMLPNTAGCQTAEEAVRVARLGREMAKLLGQEDNNFIKLEVIPDAKYLLPDPIGTLQAAEQLVKEGFAVLPYINADPLLAKRLEEIGCATVMPLGSPIGSGQGIRNQANIEIIIEQAQIPVVVDAGIGTPSEAAQAMEMGADAVLINSAIALAENPPLMGQAMGLAVKAGRIAYSAGRMPLKDYASASSPLTGTVNGG
ncbi:MAG: glycine oxidase ThiO [Microcystaceae cyanobacterium]